jgi:hypothetical protein
MCNGLTTAKQYYGKGLRKQNINIILTKVN